MKVEIKIPTMGESIIEATVGAILKPSGTVVAMDDEILELETDKVNQVLYAPQAGVLNLTVAPDTVVKIGEVIGFVDTEGAAKPVATQAAEPKPEPKVEAKPEPQSIATAKPVEPKAELKPQPTPIPKTNESNARISREEMVQDLIKQESGNPAQDKPASLPKALAEGHSSTLDRLESRRKMSKIRKVIAARLVEAQSQTAMLTTFNEVDMTQVMALRERYKEGFTKTHNVKLGFMSFFVKACVSALEAYPDVNSYIDGDEIVHREYYDIGIAVGTDRGVMVPVVRNCDHLSFAGIESSIEAFAKKARDGKITMDDLQGAGFTITNGGTYGSLLSTPILNPPQSGILGMHKIEKRPVVVNDQIVIRPMMYVALSYDHRIIDGKEAVSFLVHMKNVLEDPSRLLLEV